MSKFVQKIKSIPRKDKIKFAVFAALIVVMLAVALAFLPNIVALKDQEARDALKDQILSYGVWGWIVFGAIQLFQVIFAVIPGEPIEVIAGLLYGPWGGLAICLAGTLIGSVLIYFLVKWLGYSFVSQMINIKESKRFAFLNDTKKLNLIVFILFFIPGTPKDVLTYLVPLTEIKPLQYFVISTFARIPSVITSTFAGDAISEGRWLETVLIFAATGLVALLGIIFNDKIIAFFTRAKRRRNEE